MKEIQMKNIYLVLLSLAFTGCVGAELGNNFSPSEFSANSNQTQLIVYMPHLPVELNRPARTVTINQSPACDIVTGSYFISNIPPGETTISFNGDSHLSLQVMEGQKKFIKIEQNKLQKKAIDDAGMVGGLLGIPAGLIAYQASSHKNESYYWILDTPPNQAISELKDTQKITKCHD